MSLFGNGSCTQPASAVAETFPVDRNQASDNSRMKLAVPMQGMPTAGGAALPFEGPSFSRLLLHPQLANPAVPDMGTPFQTAAGSADRWRERIVPAFPDRFKSTFIRQIRCTVSAPGTASSVSERQRKPPTPAGSPDRSASPAGPLFPEIPRPETTRGTSAASS